MLNFGKLLVNAKRSANIQLGSPEMDALTFLSNLISSLAWPLFVLVALLVFKEPIGIVIQSLKKIKYKDLELELSNEIATGDPNIDILISELMNKSHSFKWLRNNTSLTFSDEEFAKIIQDKPKLFKSITINLRGKDGSILEKRPGIKYIGPKE